MQLRDAKNVLRNYFINNVTDQAVKTGINRNLSIDRDRSYLKLSSNRGAGIYINLLAGNKIQFYVYGSIASGDTEGLLAKIRNSNQNPTTWNFGENVSAKWGPNTRNGEGGEGKGHVVDVETDLKWQNLEQDVDNAIKDKACSVYSEFWKTINEIYPLNTHRTRRTTLSKIEIPYNLIVFGAPGTGKSHYLEELRLTAWKDVIEDTDKDGPYYNHYERVTFYPTYSYAQFVGSYKPVMKDVDKDGFNAKNGEPTRKAIAYEFVPGPFLRILKDALRNEDKNYLLIIEEINRANAAAVFGDVFQLLDRKNEDDDEAQEGWSDYSITPCREMIEYLMDKDAEGIDGVSKDDVEELRIPSNFYIWATMNSADQGVFPLDTAFKRRWDFKYMSLEDNKSNDNCTVEVGKDCNCKWGDLRKAINSVLKRNQINEDKLLSSSFVQPDEDDVISAERFKMKVLMYLWEDAARMCRKSVFADDVDVFSDLMKKWDSIKYNKDDEGLLKASFRFDDSVVERVVLTQRVDETKADGGEAAPPAAEDAGAGDAGAADAGAGDAGAAPAEGGDAPAGAAGADAGTGDAATADAGTGEAQPAGDDAVKPVAKGEATAAPKYVKDDAPDNPAV